MKKWPLILLLWYIFVDNTPWIQEVEKKTVWILKPGWSTYKDCWNVKTKLFERFNQDPVIFPRKYLCVDMDYQVPPVKIVSPEELADRLREEITQLIQFLRSKVK